VKFHPVEQARGRRCVGAEAKLAMAAQVMAEHPAALQLRLLETVVEVAAEKNSTLVLPFPVELLRFLERSTPAGSGDADAGAATSADAPSDQPQLSAPQVPEDPGFLHLDEPLLHQNS